LYGRQFHGAKADPGHWRVKMTWPDQTTRYFGKFNSQADAERWIVEHRWLMRRQKDLEAANDH